MENDTGAYTILGEKQHTPAISTYIAHPENRANRKVVLKIFHNQRNDAPEWDQVWEQIQQVQQLQHPLVVPIVDIGTTDHQLYVATAHRAAGSLRTVLEGPRLELIQALLIASQIGHALMYAHQYNIMHINLKPENILFSQKGQAQLTDFAFPPYNPLANHPTETYFADFSYYAPEVFIGQANFLSDQYALGCIIYDLVTGTTPPPEERTSLSCLIKQYRQIDTLYSHFPDLPEEIKQAIQKSMEEIPEQRYPDMAAFIQYIDLYLSQNGGQELPGNDIAAPTGMEAQKTQEAPAVKANADIATQDTAQLPGATNDLTSLNALLQNTPQPSIYDAVFTSDDPAANPPAEEAQNPTLPLPYMPQPSPSGNAISPSINESGSFRFNQLSLNPTNNPPLAAYTLKPTTQPSIYDKLAGTDDAGTATPNPSVTRPETAMTPKNPRRADPSRQPSHYTLDEEDLTNFANYTLSHLPETYGDNMSTPTPNNYFSSEDGQDPGAQSIPTKKDSGFNYFLDNGESSPPLAAYTFNRTNTPPHDDTEEESWLTAGSSQYDTAAGDNQDAERASPPQRKTPRPTGPNTPSSNSNPGLNAGRLSQRKIPRPTAQNLATPTDPGINSGRLPRRRAPRPTAKDDDADHHPAGSISDAGINSGQASRPASRKAPQFTGNDLPTDPALNRSHYNKRQATYMPSPNSIEETTNMKNTSRQTRSTGNLPEPNAPVHPGQEDESYRAWEYAEDPSQSDQNSSYNQAHQAATHSASGATALGRQPETFNSGEWRQEYLNLLLSAQIPDTETPEEEYQTTPEEHSQLQDTFLTSDQTHSPAEQADHDNWEEEYLNALQASEESTDTIKQPHNDEQKNRAASATVFPATAFAAATDPMSQALRVGPTALPPQALSAGQTALPPPNAIRQSFRPQPRKANQHRLPAIIAIALIIITAFAAVSFFIMNGQSTASGNKTGKAIELQSTTVSAYTQVTVLTPDETTINDDTKKVDSSKPVIASPVATKTTHATPVATTKASSTTTTSTTTTTSSSSSSSSSGGKTITPTPIPTPTPSVVTASYEAESSQNTLGSNLQLFSCSLCSGGERVGWIYGSGAANALQFNDIVAGTAGNYTLQIYYYNSIANRVTDLYVSVNGGSNVEVTDLQVATVNCCDYAPYIATLTISLPKSTTNTITLSNPNGPAPDIDRIVTKS